MQKEPIKINDDIDYRSLTKIDHFRPQDAETGRKFFRYNFPKESIRIRDSLKQQERLMTTYTPPLGYYLRTRNKSKEIQPPAHLVNAHKGLDALKKINKLRNNQTLSEEIEPSLNTISYATNKTPLMRSRNFSHIYGRSPSTPAKSHPKTYFKAATSYALHEPSKGFQ
jgi:hypothetical protein